MKPYKVTIILFALKSRNDFCYSSELGDKTLKVINHDLERKNY